MAREFTGPYRRRDFLRMTTALGALGITTSLTPDLLYAQAKTDLTGVEIDYWNMIGVQNKLVRQLSESIVKAFEQKTGATVNTTWNSYGDIIGPKYRTNFQGGVKPVVFDSIGRWTGQLRSFLRPMNDYVEREWDDEARAGVDWLFPIIEQQNSGFPDSGDIYDLPFALIPQAPYIVRRDHFEQAGIDFEQNFPIRDTDHYIELCQEIQSKAGIQYPTEVYGKIWDFADTQLNGWIRSLNLDDSNFITADWSHSNATTDAWQRGVQFYVDVYQKYKLSSPNSPQSTDEEAVEQLIRGQKSIVHADILNRGTLLDKIPEQMEDGTIMWGPQFPITGGDSGSQTFLSMATFEIVKQEGDDADIKEAAAWEFVKEWFLPENQAAYAKVAGLCSRKDVWPELMGAPDRYAEAGTEMINDKAGIWSNHPKSVDIQYNLIAPHGQKMLQGAPVKEELAAYAQEVDAALKG
jgi:ABC-type glycerol-3-phosphate transport system substrate-binding protein